MSRPNSYDATGPFLQNGVRFALVEHLGRGGRPIVFRSLDALCRAIHRRRRGAPLQLADHKMHMGGKWGERRTVGVYTQSDTGQPISFIGWAWLDGASWRALQAALYDVEPNPAERAEAA